MYRHYPHKFTHFFVVPDVFAFFDIFSEKSATTLYKKMLESRSEDALVLGKPLGTISAVQMDFCHEGGGVETPVQMVWGSYLVNINHY